MGTSQSADLAAGDLLSAEAKTTDTPNADSKSVAQQASPETASETASTAASPTAGPVASPVVAVQADPVAPTPSTWEPNPQAPTFEPKTPPASPVHSWKPNPDSPSFNPGFVPAHWSPNQRHEPQPFVPGATSWDTNGATGTITEDVVAWTASDSLQSGEVAWNAIADSSEYQDWALPAFPVYPVVQGSDQGMMNEFHGPPGNWNQGYITSTAPLAVDLSALPIPPPPTSTPPSSPLRAAAPSLGEDQVKDSPRTAILAACGAFSALRNAPDESPEGALSKKYLLQSLPVKKPAMPAELRSLKCVKRSNTTD